MSSTVSKETVEAANILIQHARAMGVAWVKFGELEVHFQTSEMQAASVARNPFTPDLPPNAPAQNFNPMSSDDPDTYFNMRAAVAAAVAGSAQRE